MLRPRKSAAFTLLELIVVLVVLAVLAAIAIPTFSAVIDRSHDETTKSSLASFGREAAALAAFRGEGTFQVADFEAAEVDFTGLAASSGVLAAPVVSVEQNVEASRSASAVVVSYALSADGTLAGLAAISPSGSCVAVQVSPAGKSSSVDTDVCSGPAALDGEPVLPDPDGDGTGSGGEEPAPLTSPESVTATLSGRTVTVEWANVTGAESYLVSKGRFLAEEVPAPRTSTTVELGPGESFTFSVSSVRDDVSSTPPTESNRVSVPTAAPVVSASPAVSAPQVTLSWDDVDGATGYTIQYKRSADEGFLVAGATEMMAFTVPALQEHTVYDFRVLATTSHTSTSSEVVSAKTNGPPAQVAELRVFNQGATDAKLVWTPVTGATAYVVQRSLDGSTGWTTAVMGPESTLVSNGETWIASWNSGLTTGTKYYYRVAAVNDYSAGAYTALGWDRTAQPESGATIRYNYEYVANKGHNSFEVGGWMFTANDPLRPRGIIVYLNGQHWGQYSTNLDGAGRTGAGSYSYSRSDVGVSYPGVGENTGFKVGIGGIVAGTYNICVTGINEAASVNMGCRNVTVTAGPLN